MAHIITNDRGESIDLATIDGQYRYVANALVQHGVHSQILAALADLNRTAKRAERLETALRDAVSTYIGADKLVTAERIEALRKELAEAKAANTRLERDKARYDFCKRQMFVSTHGIAPGVTALFMPPLPVDGVMGYADEIVDRAMMPGTAANVAALTDAAQSSPEAQGKAGT